MLTGSDPRTNNEIFLAKASASSVTKNIEVQKNLTWFDGIGEITLIDCPGLSDSKGQDQKMIDRMVEKIK